jgi:hypothetical protein
VATKMATPEEIQQLQQRIRSNPRLMSLFQQATDPHAAYYGEPEYTNSDLQNERDMLLQQMGVQIPEGYQLNQDGTIVERPGWMARNWPLLLMGGAAIAPALAGVGAGAAAGGAAQGAAGATMPALTASSTLPAIAGGTASSLAPTLAASSTLPAIAGGTAASLAMPGAATAAGAGAAAAGAGAKGIMGKIGGFLGSNAGSSLTSAILGGIGNMGQQRSNERMADKQMQLQRDQLLGQSAPLGWAQGYQQQQMIKNLLLQKLMGGGGMQPGNPDIAARMSQQPKLEIPQEWQAISPFGVDQTGQALQNRQGVLNQIGGQNMPQIDLTRMGYDPNLQEAINLNRQGTNQQSMSPTQRRAMASRGY